jgi:hypothetical protein
MQLALQLITRLNIGIAPQQEGQKVRRERPERRVIVCEGYFARLVLFVVRILISTSLFFFFYYFVQPI